MNKKIRLISTSMLITIVTSFCIPFAVGQDLVWDLCEVSAYGTNITTNGDLNDFVFTTNGTINFTVVNRPPGGAMPASNSITLIDIESGEQEIMTLIPGDIVFLMKSENRTGSTIGGTTEEDVKAIQYEGNLNILIVNGTAIPEFSPILIAPLFIAVTLLALIYRRKHKT